MQLIGLTFTLVGTSVASAFSSTTLYLGGGSILDTNRTSIGGSNPIYGAITALTLTTFITDTTCLGNLTLISLVSSGSVNGAKVSFGGDLIYSISAGVFGTSTLEFIGSNAATWTNGTYQNNIVVNKSGGAVVTAGTAITWGAAGRTLTMTTAVNFLTNSTTFTLAGNPLTILNTSGSAFFNFNLNTLTLNINGATLVITNNLIITAGSPTFAGDYGFTTQNFTCTIPNSSITFQNINANPLAEYTVNGVLTLIGTAASRITLQAAGSSTFNGTITPVAQLNYLSGTIPSIGMTLSQATLASPAQLDPTNRPVITGGASPTFTITPAAGAIIGSSLSMRAGYKAKFTLTNGTSSQNVAYTTTQDIDSNAGVTITSFGSYSDSIGQPTANLFRTLNWGPLIAPSGSVYYTFVN
jgi:hypothetical protein